MKSTALGAENIIFIRLLCDRQLLLFVSIWTGKLLFCVSYELNACFCGVTAGICGMYCKQEVEIKIG